MTFLWEDFEPLIMRRYACGNDNAAGAFHLFGKLSGYASCEKNRKKVARHEVLY